MEHEPIGAYNRALVYNGENYGYCKDCMHIHINSTDKEVWNAIQNGLTQITMTNENGFVVPKSKLQWDANDEKKWVYDWKIRNILISSLGVDEYIACHIV